MIVRQSKGVEQNPAFFESSDPKPGSELQVVFVKAIDRLTIETILAAGSDAAMAEDEKKIKLLRVAHG